MSPCSGPLLAAAALLAAAGVQKVGRPDPAVRALRSVGLRVPGGLVRLGGAVEVAICIAAVLTGSWWAAALVSASYLAFAVFVAVARRRGGVLASCGCFGRADTPPTLTHIGVNLLLATGAAGAAALPPGSLTSVLTASPSGGVPLLAYSAGCAALAYFALAVLPMLAATPPGRSS